MDCCENIIFNLEQLKKIISHKKSNNPSKSVNILPPLPPNSSNRLNRLPPLLPNNRLSMPKYETLSPIPPNRDLLLPPKKKLSIQNDDFLPPREDDDTDTLSPMPDDDILPPPLPPDSSTVNNNALFIKRSLSNSSIQSNNNNNNVNHLTIENIDDESSILPPPPPTQLPSNPKLYIDNQNPSDKLTSSSNIVNLLADIKKGATLKKIENNKSNNVKPSIFAQLSDKISFSNKNIKEEDSNEWHGGNNCVFIDDIDELINVEGILEKLDLLIASIKNDYEDYDIFKVNNEDMNKIFKITDECYKNKNKKKTIEYNPPEEHKNMVNNFVIDNTTRYLNSTNEKSRKENIENNIKDQKILYNSLDQQRIREIEQRDRQERQERERQEREQRELQERQESERQERERQERERQESEQQEKASKNVIDIIKKIKKNYKNLYDKDMNLYLESELISYINKISSEKNKKEFANMFNEIIQTENTYKKDLNILLNIFERLLYYIEKGEIKLYNEIIPYILEGYDNINRRLLIYKKTYDNIEGMLEDMIDISYLPILFKILLTPNFYIQTDEQNKKIISLLQHITKIINDINCVNDINCLNKIQKKIKVQGKDDDIKLITTESILISPTQRSMKYKLFMEGFVRLFSNSTIFNSLLNKIKDGLKIYNNKCEITQDGQSYRKIRNENNIKCINLYNTYNTKKQIHNILPSYCDRIFFKTSTLTSKTNSHIYSFTPVEYNSFYDDELEHAEHNMIYGKFKLNYVIDIDNTKELNTKELNMIYISFNNSKFSEKINFKTLLDNMNKQMGISGNDIIILALQDIQNNKSMLKKELLNYLNNEQQEYTLIVDKFKGLFSQIGLFIYIKKQLNYKIQNNQFLSANDKPKEECLTLICNRSYVGYTLQFHYINSFNTDTRIDLNIVNAHLSFSPDKIDLDFGERKKQLINILKYLNKINKNQINYINILGGDLNFRLQKYDDKYDELNSNNEINRELYMYFEPKLDKDGSLKLGKLSYNNMGFNPTCVFHSKTINPIKLNKKYQQNDLFYKNKYLKYKQKYLELKK